MNKEQLEKRAKTFFSSYVESLIADNYNTTYHGSKETDTFILDRLEQYMNFHNDDAKKTWRLNFIGKLLRSMERKQTQQVSWDEEIVVRDAILQLIGTSLEEYKVIIGEKRYRSIDDP
jgi:hypothetical protein